MYGKMQESGLLEIVPLIGTLTNRTLIGSVFSFLPPWNPHHSLFSTQQPEWCWQKSSHSSSSTQFLPMTFCFTPRITQVLAGAQEALCEQASSPLQPHWFSAVPWLSCFSPDLRFTATHMSTLPSYIYLNTTSLAPLPTSCFLCHIQLFATQWTVTC